MGGEGSLERIRVEVRKRKVDRAEDLRWSIWTGAVKTEEQCQLGLLAKT